MKLYHIYRLDPVYHNECIAFVMRAESEYRAREMAAEKAGYEQSKTWFNSELTKCVELTSTGFESVIIYDFSY